MDQSEHSDLLHKIERLNSIGTALSAEQDHPRLLEQILLGAKELTGADGGSLYIIENNRLQFRLVHTTSLNLHQGGSSPIAANFPEIPLYQEDGRPNEEMVVTRAALHNSIINIPDAYNDREFDLSGTRAFDAKTGYRSESLLAVPMQDHEQRIIGVLQLINATDPRSGKTVPFSREDESLVASLASQAAVSLNRQHLIDGLESLLQALTRLIATAIDDKSPHTGGHCRRVPEITMALAHAVNADSGAVFGTVRFTRRELEELEMAAWLHDCGKITTPEYVIDKQTKLEAIVDRIQLVDQRLELLRREAEIRQLITEGAAFTNEPPAAGPDSAEIERISGFLHRCNSGGEWLPDETLDRLRQIAGIPLPSHGDRPAGRLLSDDEVEHLSIRKGTLSDDERRLINNHVEVSQRMLASLPFPEHLQQVPLIAGSHHERMDGNGYPQGIPAGELPWQARILAIADIFEALTAGDRVYRKPNRLSEALTILGRMCAEGHIDPDLFELFIRKRIYADYVQTFLKPEQRDEVDSEAICALFRAAG